jgi:hypothetical protein
MINDTWNELRYKTYSTIIRQAEDGQLTPIDNIGRFKEQLLTVPFEKRYEIFKLLKTQGILNNFNENDMAEQLYDVFPPEDSWRFTYLNSNLASVHNQSLHSDEERPSKRIELERDNTVSFPLFFRNPVFNFNQNTVSDEECSPSKKMKLD